MRIQGETAAVRALIVSPSKAVPGLLLGVTERGQVETFESPERVVAWVEKRDAAAARRGRSTITVLTWQGMPEGFEPPKHHAFIAQR